MYSHSGIRERYVLLANAKSISSIKSSSTTTLYNVVQLYMYLYIYSSSNDVIASRIYTISCVYTSTCRLHEHLKAAVLDFISIFCTFIGRQSFVIDIVILKKKSFEMFECVCLRTNVE